MEKGMDFIERELFELRQKDLYRDFRTIEGPQGRAVKIGGKELISFASNNYLDLAGDPRISESAIKATEKYGFGTASSRLITGNTALHNELESAIAEFKRTERSIVFPAGYMTNIGVITALAGGEDAVIIDRLNHASIIDGVRLSGAKLMVYQHCDTRSLEDVLEHARNYRRKLIITDTLFSMDGDIAPLPRIISLAKSHGAMVMIDEAHATGVFGATGRGVAEHYGVEKEVDIIMGTLSKSVACMGGFICGSKPLIDYIRNKARSFVYTTAMPPALCAAAIKALEIIDSEPERRDRLWRNVSYFRSKIDEEKFDLLQSSSQIIPVLLGEQSVAVEESLRLYMQGFIVPAIRPPTVPKGESRLRINLISGHTEEDIDELISAL